ncbi:DNA polymerase III delta subunit [hydrothermal vent metagenome]|uniref:DNA polymerase III subunit delta n=1 Tax=hydrothermal vent metagenome TaxID=652676 RepID=A0A1W1C9S2_9ZZZZ
MQIKSEQLEFDLKDKLASSYLLFGSELFGERESLELKDISDWDVLFTLLNTPSLFSSKRLIECHLPAKMNVKFSNSLIKILETNTDDVLVFISGKLDFQQQKSKWFNALNNNGYVVNHYEIQVNYLQPWIEKRMQKLGLKANKEVASMIAFYTEGNLLATQQELTKLKLTYPNGEIDFSSYSKQLEQQSQYTVYGLIDAALKADTPQVCKIHMVLKQEEIPIPIIVGALNKEVRQLINMAIEVRLKKNINQVLQEYKVWKTKMLMIENALKRLSYGVLQKMLMHLGRIERSEKGLDNLQVWDELLAVCLGISGKKVWIA